MSSLIRRIQRKHLRQGHFTTDDDGNQTHVKHEPKPQYTETRGDGYLTVRYTRGPRLISGARLRTQGRLADIQHEAAMRDQAKMIERSLTSAMNATANEKRISDLRAAPVHAITRQMRRHAQRSGEALPPVMGAVEKPKRTRKTARVDGVAMTSDEAKVAKSRKSRAKAATGATA